MSRIIVDYPKKSYSLHVHVWGGWSVAVMDYTAGSSKLVISPT